ncbi:MAG: ABC transporter permease [Evtepia sp.]|uniref:ABC transporter permease n=1 Tax=Evtepia sp. TaxID=2773933 RepID=UPI002A75FA83|nr:ABC transporter permease [Evtepia sp.]MDY3014893.1 ABC transporter permease [Evtepia sp.]
MKQHRFSMSPGVWTALALLLGILLWEWGAAAGKIDLFFFSRPSLVWAEFQEMLADGSLAKHLAVTGKEAGLGFLFGGILGTLAGLVMGCSPRLGKALMPLMTGLNGLPKLAIGPLIIVWFGIGLKAKALMAGLMVFFAFLFNLYAGVHSVDKDLIAAVRLLGGSRRQVLTKVIWPASLPWLLASMRTGLGLAITGAIVGEYLGSSKGMGWVITSAGERYDVARVLCCVAVLVVIVILLDGVVRLLERRFLRWQ